MEAADVNRNAPLGEKSRLSTSRSPHIRGSGAARQWPDQESLFGRFWDLGPGKVREDEFWTPHKVADRLGYSPSRIRGLCDEGALPMVKVGGRLFIHIPSLKRAGFFVAHPAL